MKDFKEPIESTAINEDGATNAVNLKDFLKLCISKWYWFVISVFVCLSIGAFIAMRTTPTYQRTALIQIRDDKHGGSLNNDFANTFADFGMFSSSADIYNELVAIKSPRLLSRVVDNLDLNVSYSTKSGLKTLPVYGSQLPFVAEFLDGEDGGLSMEIVITQDSPNATLTDFTYYTPDGNEVKSEEIVEFHTVSIDTVETPIGRIVMRPNAKFTGKLSDIKIKAGYSSPQSKVEALSEALASNLADDKATVIKLSLTDSSPERAEDILNNLIEVYNQSWVEDRNQMARATSLFINQRLVSLEGELSDVDSDISSFKSENLLPDVNEASSVYLQQATKTSDEILDLNNKLSMARYVHDYLDNPSHATSLMPANSGTGTGAIDNQINEYNRLMIERNKLASSSSENHPRVRQYDASLSEMRSAVLTAIDNEIVALNTAIHNLQRSQASATARIAANPTQAKYLMSIGRQQKVKESLYLYLLQKREENELGQTFAPYNTRLLQDAQGARTPVAPRKAQILAMALIIGLIIPTAVFYLIEMANTKVRSRKDLDALSIPFLGEIPQVGVKRKFSRSKDTDMGFLVGHSKSDPTNEAFRMLRSNLEFMNRGNDNETKVIMITSAIPGSGKTFVSMNLAASIALKNKKVLLIDLDLRRHAMSRQLAERVRQGVSAYLAGNLDIESHIAKNIDGIDNLDFMAAGAVPPNPAELIGNKRMNELIAYARQKYDIVIIDCPPTEAVEDARAITTLTDMTLYVVRIGNLERSFLPQIEKMYRENRYSRMGVILNGAPTSGAFAYKYGYNYNYK